MEEKVKLSVVTVTYKPAIEELILFIDSFYKYNDLGDEAKLIIVDNSPIDSWNKNVIINKYKDVILIENPSNPGFGASNNMGFHKLICEYVLFINNDVEFTESVFSKIIKRINENPRIGCAGIHQLGGAPSFFKKFDSPSNISNKVFNDKYHFISGAFMFFKSNIFEECGCFDKNIFMYLEEYDISRRLIEKGYVTIYIPNISFLHKVGERKTEKKENNIYGIDSYYYICKKYKINPRKYFSSKRFYLLIIYFILKLNFSEAFKDYKIMIERKRRLSYLIKHNL